RTARPRCVARGAPAAVHRSGSRSGRWRTEMDRTRDRRATDREVAHAHRRPARRARRREQREPRQHAAPANATTPCDREQWGVRPMTMRGLVAHRTYRCGLADRLLRRSMTDELDAALDSLLAERPGAALR